MNSFFRDVISLDWDDLLALLLAIGAVVGVFATKKTRSTNEVVDGDVLDQFRQLFEKIGQLEVKVAQQAISLDRAHTEIREMRKLEEFLQAKIHERERAIVELKARHDKEVRSLRTQLDAARKRITHLEHVCRRAGINGDDLNGNPT